MMIDLKNTFKYLLEENDAITVTLGGRNLLELFKSSTDQYVISTRFGKSEESFCSLELALDRFNEVCWNYIGDQAAERLKPRVR